MSNYANEQLLTTRFALSHIYTNMTFGLFTDIASKALGNIFTNMSLHPESTHHRAFVIRSMSGTLHPVLTGSGHPIRRDRNPNNLPVHFGMGCLSNPILFRHASNLWVDEYNLSCKGNHIKSCAYNPLSPKRSITISTECDSPLRGIIAFHAPTIY